MAKKEAKKLMSESKKCIGPTENASANSNVADEKKSEPGLQKSFHSSSRSARKNCRSSGDKACKSDKHALRKVRRKGVKSSSRFCRSKSTSLVKKYTLRSSSNKTHVLRSKKDNKLKAYPANQKPAVDGSSGQSKQRKKKQKKKKDVPVDELLRIRKRVRYFIVKIGFEQSMIDAYASEGWKGQSQEKIKPEKELEKAASKILHYKHAIREIFHHLDSLSLRGNLEESAFDSEGQIYSEDIFCAKCGSKDPFHDNDIILCDGACDRGFHQKCLEPPLETKNIPPDDEGWLCPECDCKLDCFNFVNDHFGTDFSVEDSWEKVFPETTNIKYGDASNLNLEGLPSDDSEDDDYNPDDPELSSGEHQHQDSVKSNEHDHSIDEKTYSNSTSSNEDSENSDSSDVSLEDDLGRCSIDLAVNGRDTEVTNDHGNRESSKRNRKISVDDDVDVGSILTAKRQRHDVDYKKLHEEVFGYSDRDSMSEDDEEWNYINSLKKEKQATMKEHKSSIRDVQDNTGSFLNKNNRQAHKKVPKERKVEKTESVESDSVKQDNKFTSFQKEKAGESGQNQIASEHTPQKTDKSSSVKSQSVTRFPSSAIKKLREVFNETHFPSRKMKEDLSNELGITFKQVCKWFSNSRTAIRVSASKKVDESGKSKSGANDATASGDRGTSQDNSKKRVTKST